MRVALAQMEVIPGRPDQNLATCLDLQRRGFDAGAEVVAFPELCLSGYLIGDLWEEESFVRECVEMGKELAALSTAGVTCFGNVGLETDMTGEDGRTRRYNAAWIAEAGKLKRHPGFDLPFFPKTLLPNYREFEETRHFFDVRRLALERGLPVEACIQPVPVRVPSGDRILGVYLCEDGWPDDYRLNVPGLLAEKGAELLVNLSASPFTLGKERKRHRVFANQARELCKPLVYVNCTGMQNNAKTLFSFDGSSTVYDHRGRVLFTATPFEARLDVVETDDAGASGDPLEPPVAERIHACLKNTLGIYMKRFGLEKVVVGVSGGIDSAVSAALFTDLLGPANVLLVNMPSVYNTETTKGLAARLMENLGTWGAHIAIDEGVLLTKRQVDRLEIARGGERQTLALSEFHMENVQARDRSSRILSALASAFGGVFPSNANKAESMVGYATLYGDHAGFAAPLADLWKHQVYALGEHLNEKVFEKEVIPRGVFEVRPSAELSAAQNPESGGGDPLVYDYHDKLFESWMQHWRRTSPEEILDWYARGELEQRLGLERPLLEIFENAARFIEDLERWWRLFKGLGVVKRVQAPPVAAVCRRAFGFDYRESLMEPYFTRAYRNMRRQLLKS